MDQARGSLSNRERTCTKFVHSRVDLGVDRLAVSFPVRAADTSDCAWDDVQYRRLAGEGLEGLKVTCSAQEGRFRVSLQTLPEGAPHQLMGRVEWNPSRVMDPDGWGLASVEEAGVTVGMAEAAARTRIAPEWSSTAEWFLRRCDVARDFVGVEDASTVVRALGAVHRPWSKKNLIHADAKRNGAQTLVVGGRRDSVRLYDKNAETKGGAPEGTLRWECEARKGWLLRYGDIGRVGEMTDESVSALGAERFEWSGMGAEVSSSVSQLVHRVMSCAELSANEQMAFIGFLAQQSAGVVSGVHRNTLSKYRRVQRELGIATVDFAECVDVVRRLDWESGQEVLRVA